MSSDTVNNDDEPLRPVVIVDDDPDDLILVRRLVRRAEIRNPVVTVEGGKEAITFLEGCMVANQFPCVVFLDIKMPRVNGFDVLQWIGGQSALKGIPVFLLSGSSHPRDIERAMKLGVTGCRTKYPTPQELRDLVESCCQEDAGVSELGEGRE